MQFRSSLKQLWVESKANPAFTALYVGGVTLTVAFTMVAAMIFYVHIGPVYPEYNRGTTAYIENVSVSNDNSMSMAGLGRHFATDFLDRAENLEYYTLHSGITQSYIQPVGGDDFQASVRYADPEFFKLYDYEFVAGHPFSQADYDSGIRNVVVSDRIARRLYGSAEEAVGKPLSVDFCPNKIVGVVREGSPLCLDSYAQVVIPVMQPEGDPPQDQYRHYFGGYIAALKFKDKAQGEAFAAELDEMMRRVTLADTAGYKLSHNLQTHSSKILFSKDKGDDIVAALRPLLLILLVLLIIPAINISGMIGGQMDRRIAEIGVRRSFGATRRALMRQVMFENFTLTLAGGITGLIVAWIVVIVCRQWILNLVLDSWDWENAGITTGIDLTPEMLLSPALFATMLVICLVLNMLSAYVPVRYSLRHPIVNSINQKR